MLTKLHADSMKSPRSCTFMPYDAAKCWVIRQAAKTNLNFSSYTWKFGREEAQTMLGHVLGEHFDRVLHRATGPTNCDLDWPELPI